MEHRTPMQWIDIEQPPLGSSHRIYKPLSHYRPWTKLRRCLMLRAGQNIYRRQDTRKKLNVHKSMFIGALWPIKSKYCLSEELTVKIHH